MKVTMAHGSGGASTSELIENIFARHFKNEYLDRMEDSAVVPGSERLAVTTDSFVVTPYFFPGGDIGRLSVCGTVNDLLMSGAVPKYLTCGCILEEGMDMDDLDKIITTIGKLDALVSIACYRESVKGQYCIPEFDGKDISCEEVIHPLIENAVSNSIDAKKCVLLTGSNASGKSTFLKTIGINVLLAQSIHTVLAKNYKAPMFRVYSSMALKDDIYEGDSYYIVEIKSMKRIIDAAKEEGCQVLCFVDEVLRGTNTIERIAASTEILKFLSDSKVECFAATHDIELTQLLKDNYELYHFEGNVSDNDVHFDYALKKGPATNRNAIKLLGVLGYDSKLVDNAQNLAEKFLTTGVWE